MKDEQIQKIIRELVDEKKESDAALAFTQIDNRVSVSVAGKENDLIMLVAKAVAEAPELGKLLEAGIQAAPLVGILFGRGESTATCDCPDCTARRAQKVKDPSVN